MHAKLAAEIGSTCSQGGTDEAAMRDTQAALQVRQRGRHLWPPLPHRSQAVLSPLGFLLMRHLILDGAHKPSDLRPQHAQQADDDGWQHGAGNCRPVCHSML